ncbi:MAG: STAS/SEC14 domain-containing protein [Candidatus Promineifilaceae bacterium]|jgi:translation initiation factor IF-3
MLKKMEQSAGDILGYKVMGTIDKSDYESLDAEVQSLLDQNDQIKMLLDMTEFKGEKASAWGKDLNFGKRFHKKIAKMAIVGDKEWEKWLTKLVDPFYAEEGKYFPVEDSAKAWAWLGEES